MSARKFKRKNFLLFPVGVLLLMLVGGLILQVIFNRLTELNRKMLRDIANEKALAVQKEFDLLEQRLSWFLVQAEGQNQQTIQAYLQKDTMLRTFLTLASLDSNVQLEDWKKNLLYRLPYVIHSKYGRLQAAIDLKKFNTYFWERESGHAYFDIVSPDGFFLVHPELSQVGKPNPIHTTVGQGAQDTIVLSNYLQMDVLRRSVALQGIFVHAQLAASVPLLITADETQEILNLSMLLGIGFLVITITFLQIIYWNKRRVQQLEIVQSELSREQATMRFERLREQMNPHFLFNALGSLQQLIAKDQEHAKRFVGKMAKVYRKMLQDDRSGWSSLEEELALVQAYFFLQEVRFAQALMPINFVIPPTALKRQIPRMSLQTLVENAIKHTVFTREQPLEIDIIVVDDHVVVKNRYRPRPVAESQTGGYGLEYIASMYRHVELESFSYEVEDGLFVLHLPLR
ncbi:hypothetical protein GCM10017764_02140 [Sphingobacterium griseoflavum]|uniref:Signal transduction histidine kinase internal region domain-containing protein n=2 Tax=Sphingobacterium griseoflavum TaxID=1474952 RepID=A0ABQ3HPQ7_9SPHI|nr:hypothetical protein GCM10017764_02140 [Sphingobacterium griseoflavum]